MSRPPLGTRGRRRSRAGGRELLAWIVIAFGAWLLLDSLHIVPHNLLANFFPTLWKFWPLLLVLAGLELLITRRSSVRWFVLGLVVIAVLSAFPQFTATSSSAAARSVAGRPMEQRAAIPLQGLSEADIAIDHDFGSLTVGPLVDAAANLAQVAGNPAGGESISVRERGAGRFQITAPKSGRRWVPWSSDNEENSNRLDVQLTPSIPLNLDVRTGAAEANLDLTDLRIKRLQFDSGLSSSTIKLPASGNVVANIRGGAASIDVEVPNEMAARIMTQSGLSSTQLDDASFPFDGQAWVSPNWDTATNRVEIRVQIGVGSVTIHRPGASGRTFRGGPSGPAASSVQAAPPAPEPPTAPVPPAAPPRPAPPPTPPAPAADGWPLRFSPPWWAGQR